MPDRRRRARNNEYERENTIGFIDEHVRTVTGRRCSSRRTVNVRLLNSLPGVDPNIGGLITGGTIGTGLPTMQGTAGFASYVAIDGVGSSDGDTGNNNGITSMDAIQEIRVVMNSYTAEFGRNTGPQINVVTPVDQRTGGLRGDAMNRRRFLAMAALPAFYPLRGVAQTRKTELTIKGDAFFINGRPTYAGRMFNGKRVEGLLMNIRAVQGIFDDLNPETAARWVYPDTKKWDPERNTKEFTAAMPEWKRHGVLAFTINLQGGSPGFPGGPGRRGGGAGAGAPPGDPAQPAAPATAPAGQAGGAGAAPPAAGGEGRGRGRGPTGPQLENTAIDSEGNLRPAYMARLKQILDRADALGMVAIVGYFYFGQDQRLKDEPAVTRAVLNATNWILDAGYRNVLVEVNNECNIAYEHEILQPARVPELIKLVQNQTRNGRRLLVSTSFGGTTSGGPRDHPDTPVTAAVIKQSDYLLIHGNGPNDSALIKKCIVATRQLGGRPVPVMINEDPNFHFTEPANHLLASVDEYTSWGYYEQGQSNYQDGFQSPPVNWTISSDNKRQFFDLVKKVTGV